MPPTRLHEDEFQIDAALVRTLLAEQLPAYAGLPLRRVTTGGTENVVFRLGDELAVRVPLHAEAVGGLLKEVRWLSTVARQVSLKVPEVVAVGEPGELFPFPWVVVRWLAGEDALTGRIDSTPDAARALGRFVAELQALDVTGAPEYRTTGAHRGSPLVGHDDAFRAALVQCEGLLDVDRVREVWDDALAAPVWDGAPTWLHADLIPGNLLVRDGRLVGVLDFGCLTTGDPAYDVTPAWHLLNRESRPVFREVIGPDDGTWRRARGVVVRYSVEALPYYLHSSPSMVTTARRGISEALTDYA